MPEDPRTLTLTPAEYDVLQSALREMIRRDETYPPRSETRKRRAALRSAVWRRMLDAEPTPEYAQLRFDLFVTALEGGIGYWSATTAYHWNKAPKGRPAVEDLGGFAATIVEEDGTVHEITPDVVQRGLDRLREGVTTFGEQPWARATPLWYEVVGRRSFDTNDADIVIQSGLFGDVRYG